MRPWTAWITVMHPSKHWNRRRSSRRSRPTHERHRSAGVISADCIHGFGRVILQITETRRLEGMMHLREFVPPILVSRFRTQPHGSPALFPSYERALAVCQGGYGDPALARVVYEKTIIYRDLLRCQRPLVCEPASLRTCLALSLAQAGTAASFHVIDFGGACGAHYFLAQAWL